MTDTDMMKPRWLYRFDNYKRAFLLLREAIETLEERPLSQLELEGIIQRFEYSWELAWKVMKDYLQDQGVILNTITPAATIRAAFAAKLIENGDIWMQALDTRNKMSHTYNLKAFEQAVLKIKDEYLSLFDALYERLLEESVVKGTTHG